MAAAVSNGNTGRGKRAAVTDTTSAVAAGSDNTIGDLGELAAALGTSAYRFERLGEKRLVKTRFEAVSKDSPADEDWQIHLTNEIACADAEFVDSLAHLHNYLEDFASEFFPFIADAKGDGGAGEAFDLIVEWGAVRRRMARATRSAELPPYNWVVELVGMVEILIERIQVFCKEAGLTPDHFRA
jgi:hypothetical protein